MEITRTVKPAAARSDVKMWHCNGCGVVHMSVGKKLLNLEREEVAGIMEAIVDLHAAEWPFSLVELIADAKIPVLDSGETIH